MSKETVNMIAFDLPTADEAVEFEAIAEILERLYQRLKRINPDELRKPHVSVHRYGALGLHFSGSVHLQGGHFCDIADAKSAAEFFQRIREFNPDAEKEKRIAELKKELATLEAK